MVTGDWDWQGGLVRFKSIFAGLGDPEGDGELPVGAGSGGCVERLARAYCRSSGHDLAVALPLGLVGLSAACQGGLVLRVDLGRGLWLDVPLVVQFVGIARSGMRKSTVLSWFQPMIDAALRASDLERSAWVDAERVRVNPGGDTAWEELHSAVHCGPSFIAASTPEGTRNALIVCGGHIYIWSGEPDVFREASAYTNSKGADGGSITIFLLGFDQDNLAVRRAKEGMLAMPEVSLPVAVLLQPGPFVQYTANAAYIERGLLSRFLLTQPRTPMPVDTGTDAGQDAMELAYSRECYRDALEKLAIRTALYRGHKAIRAKWDREPSVRRLPFTASPPPDGIRTELRLEKEGPGSAYEWVQTIRESLCVMTENDPVLEPFAQRFTSHVLRWSTLTWLADHPSAVEVPDAVVADTCLRIMPWLMDQWVKVMSEHRREAVAADVGDEARGNRRMVNFTMAGVLVRALGRLSENADLKGLVAGGPTVVGPAFPVKAVVVRALDALPKTARRHGAQETLLSDLVGMLSEGHPHICKGPDREDPRWGAVQTVCLTYAGLKEIIADG